MPMAHGVGIIKATGFFIIVSKMFHSLQDYGIVECHQPSYRNRVFDILN